MDCESFEVVRLHLGPLLQGQIKVAKLKSAFSLLINAFYLLNYVSWPLSVDTSSIWPQMRPISSLHFILPLVVYIWYAKGKNYKVRGKNTSRSYC